MFLGGRKFRPYIPTPKGRGFTGVVDKVIEGYSVEYIGNRVYLMNISTYNRVKLTKNQMEEIASEYCKA